MSKRFTGHSLVSMGGPSPCPEEFTTPHPAGKTRPRAATNKPGAELWVWSDNPAKGQGKKPGQWSRVPTPCRGQQPNSFSRQEENGKGPHLQRDHTGPALKET